MKYLYLTTNCNKSKHTLQYWDSDSIFLRLEYTSLAQIRGEMFCHSSVIILFGCSLLEGFWSTFLFEILLRCSFGLRSGDKLGQVVVFNFFFFENTFVWVLPCVWDHYHIGKFLSCQPSWDWKSSFHLVFGCTIYNIHSAIYMLSYTPLALMQFHISTRSPLCFMVGTMQSLW